MSSLTVERVTYKTNPNPSPGTSLFVPQITTLTAPRPPHASTINVIKNNNPFDDPNETEMSTSNQSSKETYSDFEPGDMARVMDFDNLPDPPQNSFLLISLEDFTGKEDGSFPERFVCIRGSYLFFCETPAGGGNAKSNQDNSFLMQSLTPLGCIPLSRTKIEFPPGGRRVFREHAFTPAKNGYEFVITHTGDEPSSAHTKTDEDPLSSANVTTNPTLRPRAFLVADSLGKREEWANAIRLRAEIRNKDTDLRPQGVGAVGDIDNVSVAGSRKGGAKIVKKSGSILSRRMMMSGGLEDDTLNVGSASSVSGKDSNSVIDEPFLKEALQRFGVHKFDEKEWVYKFYEHNNEFDAPKQVRKLEEYQKAVKQGVRGAVLEQYKYFVEASREMTVMGNEVNSLKTLVDGQVRLIDQLKSIEFSDVFRHGGAYAGSDSSDDEGHFRSYQEEDDDHDDDSLSSVNSSESESNWDRIKSPKVKRKSSSRIFLMKSGNSHYPHTNLGGEDTTNGFEIPAWLEDVTEDISAYVKECRYTNATDLILKAKAELSDIFNQHEKLTDRRLSKKQLYTIHQTNESILDLTKRMASRLTEALRRKNEAYRQLSKRERADPLSELAPLLSPICLNDDDTSLQLLVKLGYTNDAAGAYASRRSLLLMETLNERPISSEGRLDVVINAAQLSQSFFSCLAMAVEGFLDLFLMSSSRGDFSMKASIDDTSIQSSPNTKVPPGALASIVLWCDSELIKFSNAFATKVLGQLNLFHLRLNSSADGRKTMVRTPEELGEFAAAEKLKQKLASTEDSLERKYEKNGDNQRDKERKKAIDLASQCIDQAFQFSSENLDSIGLPLTPRLAGCMRSRVKGCEAEIAKMLQNRWGHFVFDWYSPSNVEDIGSSSDVNNQWRRNGKNNVSLVSPDEL